MEQRWRSRVRCAWLKSVSGGFLEFDFGGVAEGGKDKLEIRNLKLETREQKFETGNSKLEKEGHDVERVTFGRV